jgi:GNAT superfamily N-acetyltransferase
MEIRIATLDDVESLVSFNQAMALETEGKSLDPLILRSGVSRVFKDDRRGFYVVAEEEGQIIGGLLVTFEWSDWRDGWFWWIQSVYVIPEHRGKGVYSRLYSYIKEVASERNDVCGFRLYVEKENAAAQLVYERLGMEKTYYLMFEEIDP